MAAKSVWSTGYTRSPELPIHSPSMTATEMRGGRRLECERCKMPMRLAAFSRQTVKASLGNADGGKPLTQTRPAKFPPRPVTRTITAKEAVEDAHKSFPKIVAALAKAEAEEAACSSSSSP